jgi:hypothetical protein
MAKHHEDLGNSSTGVGEFGKGKEALCTDGEMGIRAMRFPVRDPFRHDQALHGERRAIGRRRRSARSGD